MRRCYYHVGDYQYVYYGFFLKQVINRQKSNYALDAGCGFRGSLPDAVKHLVGVDILRRNIMAIHQTKKGDFIVASLTYLPFRSEVFDTVISVDVMEHIAEKADVFAEIARVSQKNAHFVGSTTNQQNPLLLLDELLPILNRLFAKYVAENYDRHSRLNIGTLTDNMKTNGFDVCISILGAPQLHAMDYEFNNKKLELFGFLWILFDKLTENFRILKEMIIFEAIKK